MEQQKQNPLAFFDVETTGLDKEKDKIVEICILVLQDFDDPDPLIYHQLINPGMPIPKSASDLHGITDADVLEMPHFGDVAQQIFAFMANCDICGFNSNFFDVPMLYFHFNRAGINWDYKAVNFIDIGQIFKIKEARTLSAAYKFYIGKDLEDAHNAKTDIKATVEVFAAQLKKYPDLPTDRAALALYSNFNRPILDISGKFTIDADGEVIFNFGKHRGCKAANERGFLEWMLGPKAQFNEDTKKVARDLFFRNIK